MDLGKSTIAKQRKVKRTIAGDTCMYYHTTTDKIQEPDNRHHSDLK
jgi:hypothetical protein